MASLKRLTNDCPPWLIGLECALVLIWPDLPEEATIARIQVHSIGSTGSKFSWQMLLVT